MHIKAYKWAVSLKIKNQAQKAVLLALCNRADRNCFAWPSQETLAEDTGLTARTVRAALKALEAQHIIARQKRGSARHSGRSSDMILIGYPAEQRNKPGGITGKSRPNYRKEFPGINTGINRYYPYQEEKFSEGSRLEDTHEYDPGSNVVPFPIDGRDAA